MPLKSQGSVSRILVIVLLLLAVGGAGIYFYLQSKTPNYSIVFDGRKQVPVGAKVVMVGVEIGNIVSVKPYGTGVAVGIKVAPRYRTNLTESSRFFLVSEQTGGKMLVKNIRASGQVLKPGQVVEGTDSSFQWGAYDFVTGMNNIMASEPIQQARETMRSYVNEMDRQLKGMDWDKLGRDMQHQMETFSRKLEEVLSDEDMESFRQEIEKSYQDAVVAIDRVQNSEEAQELRRAVDNFYRKFREECASD